MLFSCAPTKSAAGLAAARGPSGDVSRERHALLSKRGSGFLCVGSIGARAHTAKLTAVAPARLCFGERLFSQEVCRSVESVVGVQFVQALFLGPWIDAPGKRKTVNLDCTLRE